ncbi:unnamed protein product [Rhizopus microsporus]
MSHIPPHYTDRFIQQRYKKALYFVQNLPASSNFQPTKNQKLELYALYKQVSEGDINTQRPGLFDVVGRAKWDAWKKLEGMSKLEAMHCYVEALLRVATEAYKKNMGREEAQRIIHTFAVMRPSGEDTTDDELSDMDDTSIASEDEEEQNYLRNIQERATVMNRRPASVASTQTMVTAPATPRQAPTTLRPPSSMSMTRRGLQINRDLLPNSFNEHEENQLIDGNPWAQHPTIKERNLRTPTSASSLRLPSPSARPSFVASSNSSSVTATPQNHRLVYTPTSSHHESFHALGPATKRALESLQNEIVALNERIDDIRRELVERDKQRTLQYRKTNPSSNDIDTNNNSNRNTSNNNNNNNNNNNSEDDGWKWVIKAALKHAGVNLLTALILFLILYRAKSPIAYAILKQTM